MMLERFFRNKNNGTIDSIELTSLPVKPSRSLFFNSKSNRIVLFHTIDFQVWPQRSSKELTGFLQDHFIAGTKMWWSYSAHPRWSKGAQRVNHPTIRPSGPGTWRNWRHGTLLTLKMAVAVLLLNLPLALFVASDRSLDVAALHTADISLHLKGQPTAANEIVMNFFKSHHSAPWAQGNWTKLHHGNSPKLVARSSVGHSYSLGNLKKRILKKQIRDYIPIHIHLNCL